MRVRVLLHCYGLALFFFFSQSSAADWGEKLFCPAAVSAFHLTQAQLLNVPRSLLNLQLETQQ